MKRKNPLLRAALRDLQLMTSHVSLDVDVAGNHGASDLNESLRGLNITDGTSHDNMIGLFHPIFAVCPRIRKTLEQ